MIVPDPIDAAAEYVLRAAAAGFWTGRTLAALAAWGADRMVWRLTTARIGVLKALGRRDAARRACEAALRRCERRRQALSRLAWG